MMSLQIKYSAILGASMLLAGLAGCAEPPAPEPRLLAEPSDLQIDHKTETHFVRLDGHGLPGDLERRRLDGFIADLGAGRPDSLRMTVRGPQSDRQLRSVANLLVADGVDPQKIVIQSGSGKDVERGSVAVIADRYAVQAPDCPGWSTGPVATNDNSTRGNLGCANLANFAAMVADPHDLVAGRSSTRSDAQAAGTAVQRYKTDKVKALPKHDVFTVGAGGGEGGGQQ